MGVWFSRYIAPGPGEPGKKGPVNRGRAPIALAIDVLFRFFHFFKYFQLFLVYLEK
jgi:hypothetical protein